MEDDADERASKRGGGVGSVLSGDIGWKSSGKVEVGTKLAGRRGRCCSNGD